MEDSKHILTYAYEGDAPEADVERFKSVTGLTLLDQNSYQLLVELHNIWTALFLLDMTNNLEGWLMTTAPQSLEKLGDVS